MQSFFPTIEDKSTSRNEKLSFLEQGILTSKIERLEEFPVRIPPHFNTLVNNPFSRANFPPTGIQSSSEFSKLGGEVSKNSPSRPYQRSFDAEEAPIPYLPSFHAIGA